MKYMYLFTICIGIVQFLALVFVDVLYGDRMKIASVHRLLVDIVKSFTTSDWALHMPFYARWHSVFLRSIKCMLQSVYCNYGLSSYGLPKLHSSLPECWYM